MKERFFLILSCSGGSGHRRAGEALHRAASSCKYPIRTMHEDVLNFTSRAFKRLYSESYIEVVNRLPEVYGYLYQRSESKPYQKKGLLKVFDQFNYKRYVRVLQDLSPDAIICTHFLPFVAISDRLKRVGIKSPIFASTTDFDIHQLWVDSAVERYYVYHEESAWQLQSKNVSPEKILVKGIPLMPEFRTREDRSRIEMKLGLQRNCFTVLLLSGGFGIGRVEEIAQETAKTLGEIRNRQFCLLVVCGKNEHAKKNLEKTVFPSNVRATVYGFVDNVHELMDASDVLVSKSGGLTSSEAMAKSLPMIIIDPIPGQESRNADMIVEHGAGWRAINPANLSYKLRRVVEDEKLLSRARESTKALAKPNAAQEILQDVYHYLEHTQGGSQ